MAAENEKNGVPLCSKGCTDPGMSELLGTSPARWSIGTRKRATTVLLAHASGHHEVRLAKPTLAQRVRHTAVHCLHHVRSFRMSSMCMCLYLTALSAMLTCATCAEAFNYLLAPPLWRMRDLVDRRCELLYENFAGLVYCNHSEQKYMHKARFPCIQVAVRVLDEGGRVVAPKNEVGRNKPSIYMRGCGRQSPAEKLEHMQQDVLDLKQRLKNCESHSGDTDGGPVTHDAEEHVYLYASYYEYSLYEAEHERSENYTWQCIARNCSMSFAANVLATWEYRRLLREKSELYEFLGAMRDITFDKSDTLVRALFQNTSISACDMEYHLQNQMYNMSRNSRHCNASRPSLPCKFHEGLGVALLREDVNSRVVDLALMIVPAVLALLLIVFLLAQCLLLGGTPWDEEDDDI